MGTSSLQEESQSERGDPTTQVGIEQAQVAWGGNVSFWVRAEWNHPSQREDYAGRRGGVGWVCPLAEGEMTAVGQRERFPASSEGR